MADDSRPSSSAPDAAAVALGLVVGALVVALALYPRHPTASPSIPISSINLLSHNAPSDPETQRQQLRIRAFIDNQVAARDVVLFVDAASSSASCAHLQRLFKAIFPAAAAAVECAVVDLETTAQGKAILQALQQQQSECNDQQTTEFLFVKGVLLGDFSCVKGLLADDALVATLEKLGVACTLDGIRVDVFSDAGFIVLGPQHCFQTVGSDGSTEDAVDTNHRRLLLETRPLDTVEEFLGADVSELLLPRIPLAERTRNPTRRSKLLVCHDMRGGYLGDRFTQGSADFDAYRFYQWDLVDLFVYFGHHLVCIPPLGWIAAGHRNGTRVLGAFVTEGDHGAVLAGQIFKDRASAEACASKLAALVVQYGFDGFLVNIENSVAPELLANVYVFLETLSTQLKAGNPAAQVIWYASLARDGRKKHQMRLDTDGAPFFRCVDGFFTDYGWTPEDAKYSAAFDLDRRFDVFMGVDVFGRHDTLGGGKMSCDVALRAAWNAGVSAALFAPGWTHECLQHEDSESEAEFVAVEERFWAAIRSSGWKPRSPGFSALGGRDSLYSAFNAGRGKSVWVDGVKQVTSEWSNLVEMDQQPVAALHAGVRVQARDSTLRAVLTHEVAFQGGTSVSVKGEMSGRDKAYVKLFDVDLELTARHITEISYTTSPQIDGSVALLVLTVCPGLDRAVHQVILRTGGDSVVGNDSGLSALSRVAGVSPGKHFYSPVWTKEYAGDARVWVKKTYRVGGMIWDQRHIVEIGVLCTKKPTSSGNHKFHACVGEVCVVGSADVRGRASLGTIAAEPKRCENARVSEFKRIDSSSVAFHVDWDFSAKSGRKADGEAVQHVLVYLHNRTPKESESGKQHRTLLGKSFGASFKVERCPWKQQSGDDETSPSPSLLQLELVSVSWTGTSASSACSVYLSETS